MHFKVLGWASWRVPIITSVAVEGQYPQALELLQETNTSTRMKLKP
jgi:hypothetical protein